MDKNIIMYGDHFASRICLTSLIFIPITCTVFVGTSTKFTSVMRCFVHQIRN